MANQKNAVIPVSLQPVSDGKFHKVYIVYKPKDKNTPVQAALSGLQFAGN
jgi:hypothetical protein